ncbi:MAG: hypothetical protein FGF53_00155 [Candidatus Brockarchaeota archaeon]|nr:hypothetical protein [Candidatus Brockarchaeota archaeon]MBO3808209.1 hypothetical protein [Candidatus Brockarchaeota archaeon]
MKHDPIGKLGLRSMKMDFKARYALVANYLQNAR